MEMAALISVAHKLNYALLSCKSIPFIIARGHMLAMSSYTFSQQDLASTCIRGNGPSLSCCPKSYTLFLFTANDFFNVKKNFWYVVELCVRIAKVADIEVPHWQLYEQIRNSKPQGHIDVVQMLQWNLLQNPQICGQVEMNRYFKTTF